MNAWSSQTVQGDELLEERKPLLEHRSLAEHEPLPGIDSPIGTNRLLRSNIKEEACAARFRHALGIRTFEDFMGGIEKVRQLPQTLRGELLAAYGARILRLPPGDPQLAACAAFCVSVEEIPENKRPGLLNNLHRSAGEGTRALDRWKREAFQEAKALCRQGENVQALALKYDFSSKETKVLEAEAAAWAIGQISIGVGFAKVIQMTGISNPSYIHKLKLQAVQRELYDLHLPESRITFAKTEAIRARYGITEDEMDQQLSRYNSGQGE